MNHESFLNLWYSLQKTEDPRGQTVLQIDTTVKKNLKKNPPVQFNSVILPRHVKTTITNTTLIIKIENKYDCPEMIQRHTEELKKI